MLSVISVFDSPRPLSFVDPNRRTLHFGRRSAQIEANHRDAPEEHRAENRRGEGPRTGTTPSNTADRPPVLPVLPQEDPKELEDRTQQVIAAMKPRNPLDFDLVYREVRLSGELDRAERVGTTTWPTGSEWPAVGTRDGRRGRDSTRSTTSAASCF